MIIQHHCHLLPSTFSHSHNEYEIQYCISGSGTFHYYPIPGSSYREEQSIKPGTFIFNPKGLQHGMCNVKYPYDRIWVQFSDEDLQDIQGSTGLLNELISTERLKPVFWDLSSNAELFENLLEKAYSAFMNDCVNQQIKQLYLTHYIGLLFCEINRCYPQYFSGFTASNLSDTISQVKRYLDEHYNESLRLSDIADLFHFSQSYLTKQFTEQIGTSPRQYLTQKRLSMARKELCSTGYTVQEIALRNGFGDVNYFIQMFKKNYDTTPKQYQCNLRTLI